MGGYTASWTAASEQYKYFSNPDNGYINGSVVEIKTVGDIPSVIQESGIQIGDLMYFAGEDGNSPHHAAMITKIDNKEIYFSAMTTSRSDEPLSERMKEVVLIVKIKNDAK